MFRAYCSILQLVLYLNKVACCVKYVTITRASDASVTTAQKTISRCSCPYNTVAVACVSSILAVACVNYFTVLSVDSYLALSGIYDFTHPPEDITTNKYNRRLASSKHSLLCRVASLNTGYYICRRETSHLAWLCLNATHVAVNFSRRAAHCDRATSPAACAPFPFE